MRTSRPASLALALTFPFAAALSFAEQPVQGSFAITWDEIQAKPTGTSGMARSVLRSPTATLDELEIHVTALPAGKTTHAPHTHANEELIVIREGTLDAYQNGKVTRVGPGSLLFMGSNEPHNVTNVGSTTAVYHVVNWASPGMKKSSSANPGDDVRAFYQDFRQAAAASGSGDYASFFAEDALLLPPNAPPVSGRAAIREWQQSAGAEANDGGTPSSAAEDELQMSGAFVIYRSTVKGQRTARSGAAAEPFETKYFDVLRRKPDGGYEIVRRMWSSNLR
jgi:ketosteroid isomerase-like protein/quercetin dioxygenase-like cupin family protein